ncbi:MAG: PD-(D/E)XK nuclease family protein [Firmicutes bacterium]|nr:PD-(D/E)XK nuclease family protein [Bacillota bacterium]
MINVYYGRSDRDMDRFLYSRIAERMPLNTILLVPDQFTLQAERDAFSYMNAEALLELEIMSFGGLSRRILGYAGRPPGTVINKYGRYMLLSVLSSALDSPDGIFGETAGSTSFLELLTDLITELKQYGVTPEELLEMEEAFADDALLQEKLRQVRRIYSDYRDATEGKFTDSEDLQAYVNAHAAEYPRIADSVFWIAGFDYLVPGMLELVEAIAADAPEVNIVLAGDDTQNDVFEVPRRMGRQFREMASRAGTPFSEEYIGILTEDPDPEVRIVKAGDFYAEAESAAVRITELVREQGYRYRDIVVICNDMTKRGSVYRRVFEDYGIPLFVDDKRSIAQEPEIEFIDAMTDCVVRRRRFDDVFRMLKTGFSPLDDNACDLLENYCRQYHIRSGRWKSPFRYGSTELGEERLAEIDGYRQAADAYMTAAEQLFRGRKTVLEKTEALYTFLTEQADMPRRIEQARQELENSGLLEQAGITAQIWEAILGIFDQIVEVLGSRELSDGEFAEILKEGFREVRIGMIPTTGDQVLMGTMQRSRFSQVRALFVMGANEGILPEEGHGAGLLSEEEMQMIEQRFRSVGHTDEQRRMEQELAVFRNLGKVQDLLVLSYADQDTDGSELRPSLLVTEMLLNYGSDILEYDVLRSGDDLRLVQTEQAAMPHLIRSLRGAMDGREPEPVWKAAALVLTGRPEYEMVRSGLFHTNRVERAGRAQVRELFGRGGSRELIFSASSLEKYSRCPFSFFVSYGLRPSEQRSFETDMRSVGDIYHDCLKRVARALTDRETGVSGEGSGWQTITEEEVAEMVSGFIDEFALSYREGVLDATERDRYLRERIKPAAALTAWLMIEQVRSGAVRAIYFEQGFGQKPYDLFPPIVIELEDGGQVAVEGKIDRVDILQGEDHDLVRIIDYKTGRESFDLEEVRSGWRMQLMIYLKGAMGGIRAAGPAGVFYFSIRNQNINITGLGGEDAEREVRKKHVDGAKLDGILINDNEVISGMDREFTGSSSVIPVYRKKDGTIKDGNALLSEEDFADLIRVNDENMKQAAEGLAGGRVDIDPAKGKQSDACRYCSYRSICSIV